MKTSMNMNTRLITMMLVKMLKIMLMHGCS